jgi:hypothetical protein
MGKKPIEIRGKYRGSGATVSVEKNPSGTIRIVVNTCYGHQGATISREDLVWLALKAEKL